MSPFEDQLWSHLAEQHDAENVVARRSSRQRPRTLTLTAGAAGVIGAAVVTVTLLVGGTTSTPPAFALTQNADGTVTVTLNDVAAGIPGLNAEFARLGIRERAVPIEAGCTAGPAVGYMAPLNAPGMNGMSTTFTFSSATEHPGYTGFIAARQVGPDHVEIAMGAMQNGTIPPCFPEQTMQVIPVPESGTSTGTTTSSSPTTTAPLTPTTSLS
jgi:hypothetical protein